MTLVFAFLACASKDGSAPDDAGPQPLPPLPDDPNGRCSDLAPFQYQGDRWEYQHEPPLGVFVLIAAGEDHFNGHPGYGVENSGLMTYYGCHDGVTYLLGSDLLFPACDGPHGSTESEWRWDYDPPLPLFGTNLAVGARWGQFSTETIELETRLDYCGEGETIFNTTQETTVYWGGTVTTIDASGETVVDLPVDPDITMTFQPGVGLTESPHGAEYLASMVANLTLLSFTPNPDR